MGLSHWEITLRLLLAAVYGGLIGMERHQNGKPVGRRTHAIICLSGSIIAIIGLCGFENLDGFTRDPTRLPVGVLTGLGFLGAGVIWQDKGGVKGLTTAAGLWTSAIIGLTFGGGFYEGGILATVFIMLAELVFSRIEYRVLENVPEINLYMEYEGKHCLDDVLQLYRSCNIKVLNIQITRSAENGEHNACAIFSLRLPRSCGVEKLLTLVGRCEGIVSVEEL